MTTRAEIEAAIRHAAQLIRKEMRGSNDSYSTGYRHGAADFAKHLRSRLSSMKDDANDA